MRYRYRFLMLAVWLAACLLVFHLFYENAKEEAIADLNARQTIHMRQAAMAIEGFFEHWIALLSSTARRDSIIALDEDGKNQMEFIYSNYEQGLKAISRVDEGGRIVHAIPYDPEHTGADLSGQRHVQEMMATHKPVLSSVFETVQKSDAVALHVPVFEGDTFRGSLGILFDFGVISKQFLKDILIGETGYAWMVDKDGIELFCPVPGHVGNSVFDNCRDFPTILSMAREMLQCREGVTTYLYDRIREHTREVVKKHAVYMPVRIANSFWSIVVASPEDEVLASLQRLRKGIFLIIAVLFAGSMFFSYSALRSWGIVKEEKIRRKAEEELRGLSTRQQALLAAIPDIIMEVNAHKVYSWANRAGLDFFGEDVIGKEASWYFEGDQQTYDAVQPLFSGDENVIYVESWQRRKDAEKRLLAWWCRVLKDDRGNVTGALSSARDITERKLAEEEREKLQAQLLQAQKMESVGRLAGGVAHDFNNMLGIIVGHAELAAMQTDAANPLHQNLGEILKAAHRSADLVRQLLAFARKQTVSPKVLDLNDTVSGMLKMLRRLIGEDIELAWMPGHDLWPVKVDPIQIDQILANLAVNARDAIAGVGKVTIETANVTIDQVYCAGHPGFLPGDYILLAVSDNGAGMSQEVLERLFEPFFTTKELGKGTGLGLSTIYGIVKQNDGFIDVYSEPGVGTMFKIYLPRLRAGEMEVRAERKEEPLKGGTETVLLVEDEAAILQIGKAMLEELGYAVLTADCPGDAIRLAHEQDRVIHLLLTDVVMPEMNGRDLAERLMSIHPGLRVLYMSGYTANAIAHHGVLEEGVIFIDKPFSMRDLASKVREALDIA
ncbi:MAG: ATP-binding protein [Thermodesulfobacteriota bacterium]